MGDLWSSDSDTSPIFASALHGALRDRTLDTDALSDASSSSPFLLADVLSPAPSRRPSPAPPDGPLPVSPKSLEVPPRKARAGASAEANADALGRPAEPRTAPTGTAAQNPHAPSHGVEAAAAEASAGGGGAGEPAAAAAAAAAGVGAAACASADAIAVVRVTGAAAAAAAAAAAGAAGVVMATFAAVVRWRAHAAAATAAAAAAAAGAAVVAVAGAGRAPVVPPLAIPQAMAAASTSKQPRKHKLVLPPPDPAGDESKDVEYQFQSPGKHGADMRPWKDRNEMQQKEPSTPPALCQELPATASAMHLLPLPEERATAPAQGPR